MVEERRRQFYCPYHSGVNSELQELCRRCDEFKEEEGKEGNAINEIRESCARFREGCKEAQLKEAKDLADRLDKVPKTATLLSIVGVVITILSIIGGLWFNAHEKDLKSLRETDMIIRSEVKEVARQSEASREKLAEKMDETKEVVIEIKTLMKKQLRDSRTP